VSVSVVVPVFNGARSIPELAARLTRTLSDEQRVAEFEVILVDDCSRDESWSVIQELSGEYPSVRGLGMSRNYGQHNALLAGIRVAENDLIITIDDDLEHPPEAIPQMLDALADDIDLVYATPEIENHSASRNIASRLVKRSMSIALGPDIAHRASAYRLRDGFSTCSDPFLALDVLLSWTTTRVAFVEVEMAQRRYGSSNYTFKSLVRHALNMATGYSTLPLRLVTWIGFGAAIVGLLALVYVLVNAVVRGRQVAGFAFLASSVAIFGGAQLLALGLIGEYLGRMHFRSMDRPVYTIARTTDRTAAH